MRGRHERLLSGEKETSKVGRGAASPTAELERHLTGHRLLVRGCPLFSSTSIVLVFQSDTCHKDHAVTASQRPLKIQNGRV